MQCRGKDGKTERRKKLFKAPQEGHFHSLVMLPYDRLSGMCIRIGEDAIARGKQRLGCSNQVHFIYMYTRASRGIDKLAYRVWKLWRMDIFTFLRFRERCR